MHSKYLSIGLLAAMPFAASNCGSHDTDVGGREHHSSHVIDMPNHFSSVASTCDDFGNRVYEGDHGDSGNGGGWGFVIADDCKKKGQ